MLNDNFTLMQDVNRNTMGLVCNKMLSGKTDVPAAGTAVKLLPPGQKSMIIIIKCPAANTGVLYVGDSNVSSTNGITLETTGEQLILYLDNYQSPVYVDVGTNGDDAEWIILWSE